MSSEKDNDPRSPTPPKKRTKNKLPPKNGEKIGKKIIINNLFSKQQMLKDRIVNKYKYYLQTYSSLIIFTIEQQRD